MPDLYQMLFDYGNRLASNVRGTIDNMTLEKWIRIVIIVGGYALLRPYLMKLGGRSQLRQHEKEAERAEAEAAKQAEMSRNKLLGVAEIPDDTDDEADGDAAAAQATASDWGKTARRRQRRVVRKLVEAEEERLREAQEDEEDKDIEEFLVE